MKVLTAAAGTLPEDFTGTVPGEMVYLGWVCDRDRREGRDRGCGCGRAFAGLTSSSATTVAEVADLDVTLDAVTDLVVSAVVAGGWPVDYAQECAAEMVELAAEFPVGTRLRRWIEEVVPA